MSTNKLHKLESYQKENRAYLSVEDSCAYFMEKLSEGYLKSNANQLIWNYKKDVSLKGTDQWKYKELAIQEFAKDLCSINFGSNTYSIIPAPTSKPRNHPQWDNRIDKALDFLGGCRANLHIEKAIDMRIATMPVHQGGSRNPNDIYNNLVWNGFMYTPSETVFLVDDVLTTGSHFTACKQFIFDNDARVKNVVGIFWALHVWA